MADKSADKPKVTVTLRPSGAYRIEGPFELLDDAGMPYTVPPPEKYRGKSYFSLCGCGLSQSLPYCDGSHKEKQKTA